MAKSSQKGPLTNQHKRMAMGVKVTKTTKKPAAKKK